MNELKPCPFCGGNAALYVAPNKGVEAFCYSCNARSGTKYTTENRSFSVAVQSAIEAWNRRTQNETN